MKSGFRTSYKISIKALRLPFFESQSSLLLSTFIFPFAAPLNTYCAASLHSRGCQSERTSFSELCSKSKNGLKTNSARAKWFCSRLSTCCQKLLILYLYPRDKPLPLLRDLNE